MAHVHSKAVVPTAFYAVGGFVIVAVSAVTSEIVCGCTWMRTALEADEQTMYQLAGALAAGALSSDRPPQAVRVLAEIGRYNGYIMRMFLKLRMPNVPRGDGGWEGSHPNHVITLWPDRELKKKMRLPRVTFQELVRRVEPLLQPDDNCENPNLRIPSYFKVGVGVHHLAHGGSFYATAGHAHIAECTARKYVTYTCEAIIENLVPVVYLRPPTALECQQSQRVFANMRQMGNIGLAWMILADMKKWLGSPDGLLISDGAFSMSRVVLTPYHMPHGGGVLEDYKRWFNFCFSFTRIVVEQVFGI
eukprot:jgi/Tetstr1/435747/TSEL_024642.t1